MRTTSELTVVMVGEPNLAPAVVLKMPRTPPCEQALKRHVGALKALHADERLQPWRHLLPSVVTEGMYDGQYYVFEKAMPGIPAQRIFEVRGRQHAIRAAAAETIKAIHRATSTPISPDDALRARWIDGPIRVLSEWNATQFPDAPYTAAIERVRAELTQALTASVLTVSRIHGDFWLRNVLASAETGTLTAILDWDDSSPQDLPQIDLMHLLLMEHCVSEHRQLGEIVVDKLEGNAWTAPEQAILTNNVAGPLLENRPLLVLGWLRHVTATLTKTSRYLGHRYWEAWNIERVLRRL